LALEPLIILYSKFGLIDKVKNTAFKKLFAMEKIMKLGVIGLGRMGSNIVRRLIRHDHECVVYNRSPQKVETLAAEGAIPTLELTELVSKLPKPRIIWLMLPAGNPTEQALTQLAELVEPGDILIDGGNTHYIDDIRRAKELKAKGVHYVDVGTSGGVWGLDRGYCLMMGGETEIVNYLDPIFKALAPGRDEHSCLQDNESVTSTAAEGYLHCGIHGSGHLIKASHNAIEYGLMMAYAEGLNVLYHANIGKQERQSDSETTPLRHPEHYQYDFNLADISEVWRHGSVIGSWLLDLTAMALRQDPQLSEFNGRVADSGEGRWTLMAAIDQGTPVPVLSAALFQRFSSRGEDEFACKLLSAMRFQFGGHLEQTK
jgi:6-phosphogluconate dehydrogenase